MPLRLTPRHTLFVAMSLLGLQFYLPTIAVSLASVLVTIIIWRADPKYFHVLLVLFLGPANFLFTSRGGDFPPQTANGILIGSFTLNTPFVGTVVAALRVMYGYFFKAESILLRHKKMLFLWLSAFIPTSIICYLGWAEGNNGWSAPMRYLFIAGMYFYGMILALRWPMSFILMLKRFSPYIIVVLILTVLGLFHNRLLWYLPALVPALSLIDLRRRNHKILLVVMLILTGLYSLGFSMFGESTFTLKGLFIISIITSMLSTRKERLLTKLFTWNLGLPAIIISIFFVLFAVNYAKRQGFDKWLYTAPDLTIREKLQSKIFYDRARVWSANIEYILEPPYFFKPSGRPVQISHPSVGYIYVTWGAHNAFLQAIRENGWYAGVVIIIILCNAVLKNVFVYRYSKVSEIKAIAVATIATGTYGAMTGHYILSLEAGFWIMALAGGAYSVSTSHTHPSRRFSRGIKRFSFSGTRVHSGDENENKK